LTDRTWGGDNRGGAVEGVYKNLHPPPTVPRDVVLGVGHRRSQVTIVLPDELELLLERIVPDYLGYDATVHSDECYTIILLTLDYRYTAWRANLSLDGRWTLNPLDWAGTYRVIVPEEGESW
jgi:hypothetical protein